MPPRRAFLLALLGALAGLAGPLVAQERAARRPNVVFVLADDLGYGELGCYGQTRIRTPRLDQLAREGLRLTRHYSGSPVCAPSRCVLLTGKHPGHAAVRDNREIQPEGQWPLPAGERTLGEVFQAAGHRCGAFGKWGLGIFGSSGDPLARGFPRFYGYNCQRHAHSYWPAFLYDDARRIALDNDPPVPGGGRLGPEEDPADPASYARFSGRDYAPERILAAALDFVRAQREEPFLLFYPSVLPHLALHVPEAEARAYDFPETPYGGEHGYTPQRTPRAAYAAMISHLDRDVGALLDLLDELELARDTIVVFTSDNGATHSPVGGTDVDFFDSTAGLRGRKGSLYEGGVRVPALVRWPGHVAAGALSAHLTGFEDWLPTLAELCGIPAPEGLDGRSFAAVLRGEETPPRPFLYREFAGYGGWQAVWVGDHKLVRRNLQQGPLESELYDLAADPAETRDLSAALPDRRRELEAVLAAEHVPSPVFPLGALGEE